MQSVRLRLARESIVKRVCAVDPAGFLRSRVPIAAPHI
jgi:hypothetical protein